MNVGFFKKNKIMIQKSKGTNLGQCITHFSKTGLTAQYLLQTMFQKNFRVKGTDGRTNGRLLDLLTRFGKTSVAFQF